MEFVSNFKIRDVLITSSNVARQNVPLSPPTLRCVHVFVFFISLQVRVLTDLGMFSEATRELSALLLGEKLPKISDIGFRTVENKTVRVVLNFTVSSFSSFADMLLINRSFVPEK